MTTVPFSWIHPDIEVKDARCGNGLFALKNMGKGTRVIVFGGYMLTLEFFNVLPAHMKEHPFQVADDIFFGQIAEHELSAVDYLNHSCEPNCGFKGQAFVVTMRDIVAGEEITIDYAMCTSSTVLRDIKCRCGNKTCRGMTRYNDWENLELQKKYKGYFQYYLEEKIKNLSI